LPSIFRYTVIGDAPNMSLFVRISTRTSYVTTEDRCDEEYLQCKVVASRNSASVRPSVCLSVCHQAARRRKAADRCLPARRHYMVSVWSVRQPAFLSSSLPDGKQASGPAITAVEAPLTGSSRPVAVYRRRLRE